MSSVREMLTKWSFNVDHEKLEKFENQLESIKHRLDFLAAAEVAKGLYEIVEKFGEMAEHLHVASAAAGVTVEEMQKLNFAAQQSGVSAETMQMSLFKLSRALYAAKKGTGDAALTFAKLNINPANLKNSKDALYAIADGLKAVKDPMERTALMSKVLGRGSKDMALLLSQGSAGLKKQGEVLEGLGGVLSGNQIEALTEATHSLGRFWAMIKGIAGTIAANFAPVIVMMVEHFQALFMANRELIQTNITEWLGNIAFVAGFLTGLLEDLVVGVIKLAEFFGIPKEKILTIVAAFASLVTGILLFKGAMMLLGPVFSAIMGPFRAVFWIVSQLGITWLGLATRLSFFISYLITAGQAIAAFAATGVAPFLLVVAAIAALIVVGHDLYQMFFNGKDFKDTWIGQGVKYLQDMIEKVTGLKNLFGMNDALTAESGALVSPGFGVLAGESPSDKFLNTIVPDIASSGGGIGPVSNNITAPITINVPQGTNPADVGKHVQAGIKDHLDSVMRETKRSHTPAVAH